MNIFGQSTIIVVGIYAMNDNATQGEKEQFSSALKEKSKKK